MKTGERLLFWVVCFLWLQQEAAAQSFPASGISLARDTAAEQSSGRVVSSSYRVIESAAGDAVGSRIGPGDLLDISVFEAPEMNRSVRVSSNGEISLDLLGPVMAAGLTPAELESALREKLRLTYMKDPHVNVFVRDLESHPVTVIGAVKKPGVFQIQNPKPILEVLSLAEGLGDDAGDKVLILRRASVADPASLSARNPSFSDVAPGSAAAAKYTPVAAVAASAESLRDTWPKRLRRRSIRRSSAAAPDSTMSAMREKWIP
jgi:protein involved in polysaccharide export with SLBB domain